MLFLASLLAGSDLNANLLGWLGGLVLVAGFGLGFSGLALALASRTDNPGAYHVYDCGVQSAYAFPQQCTLSAGHDAELDEDRHPHQSHDEYGGWFEADGERYLRQHLRAVHALAVSC